MRNLYCAMGIVLAGALLLASATARAEHANKNAGATELPPPQATRETCTSIPWGFDGHRTDCRYEALGPSEAASGARGICIIAYGKRSCY